MALLDVALDDSLDLPAGGTRFITGRELVAQRIRMRLSRFLGEELLNQSLGLPFIEWRTLKPLPIAEIGAVVRREVETIPGVTRVEGWSATFNATTRTVLVEGIVWVGPDAISLSVSPVSDERANRSVPLILLQNV